MQAERVAMFLTSNPNLLNKAEKWAWRQAGIKPLRRSVPVSGMNKTPEGRKHTSAVCMWGGRGYKEMLYGWEWVIPEARLRLIHSPPLTPLASVRSVFAKQLLCASFLNTDLLIYICLTDLCYSHCWRIIWRAVRSPICISSLPYTTPLTSSSPCELRLASVHSLTSRGSRRLCGHCLEAC